MQFDKDIALDILHRVYTFIKLFFSYFMQNNAEMLAKVIKMQQKAIIYGILCLIL